MAHVRIGEPVSIRSVGDGLSPGHALAGDDSTTARR
jgi:hypothetical protein